MENKYKIVRKLFLASDLEIESNLEKIDADKMCLELNENELDAPYRWYEVEKQ